MKTQDLCTLTFYVLGALTLGACDEPGASESFAPIGINDKPVVTPAELGLGNDWTEKEAGLWTHPGAGGELEFVGIGEDGQLHALAALEAAEADLKQILVAEDRDETRTQLEELDVIITELRTSEASATTEPALRCVPSVSASADAYPSTCGVSAKASASYSHCVTSGRVLTYAQVTCGYEAKTHQCGYKYGASASCTASTSIVGASPCKSFSYAEISAPNVYVYVWDDNLVRGACSSPPPPPPVCGSCQAGKSCHCGENVCLPNNTICP